MGVTFLQGALPVCSILLSHNDENVVRAAGLEPARSIKTISF
jgi:hypothetical protein